MGGNLLGLQFQQEAQPTKRSCFPTSIQPEIPGRSRIRWHQPNMNDAANYTDMDVLTWSSAPHDVRLCPGPTTLQLSQQFASLGLMRKCVSVNWGAVAQERGQQGVLHKKHLNAESSVPHGMKPPTLMGRPGGKTRNAC